MNRNSFHWKGAARMGKTFAFAALIFASCIGCDSLTTSRADLPDDTKSLLAAKASFSLSTPFEVKAAAGSPNAPVSPYTPRPLPILNEPALDYKDFITPQAPASSAPAEQPAQAAPEVKRDSDSQKALTPEQVNQPAPVTQGEVKAQSPFMFASMNTTTEDRASAGDETYGEGEATAVDSLFHWTGYRRRRASNASNCGPNGCNTAVVQSTYQQYTQPLAPAAPSQTTIVIRKDSVVNTGPAATPPSQAVVVERVQVYASEGPVRRLGGRMRGLFQAVFSRLAARSC